MSAKRIRKLLTVVLSTSMVLGCTITAFADATNEVAEEGSGTYEGGKTPYNTISVTLPTDLAGIYDYIADPNGLIAATSATRYGGADFSEGTTGIFFETVKADAGAGTAAKYTNKSKVETITNNNAQDLDITIKLEQKTAGSEVIEYSDTDTFENTDKANKIYLAVTDGAESNAKTAALGSSAAILTTTVAGVPANYKQVWDGTAEKYAYELKAQDQLSAWNSCSYNLVGALNKNATWEDGVTFPEIKVTWSYAEHSDNAAPSIATTSYTMAADTAVTVQYSLGVGDLAAEGIESVVWSSAFPGVNLYDSADYITKDVNAKTFTLTVASINNMITRDGDSQTIKVTFDDGTIVDLTFNDPE